MTAHDYQQMLSTLGHGDIVTTGVTDPWTTTIEARREEIVQHAGRMTITTDLGTYLFTGRQLTLRAPLAFPRRILSVETGR